MENEKINCPVCGTLNEIGHICTKCGFEPHLFTKVPSETIQQYERERLEYAQKIWKELQELRIKKSTGSKPLGFLVTDRLVVYCVYDGVNLFGSKSTEELNEGETFQSLLFPGVKLSPKHFQIEVNKSDDEKKTSFYIRRPNNSSDGVGVYLNTLTQQIEGNPVDLNSGDSILLSTDSNNVDIEIKFRKNIN